MNQGYHGFFIASLIFATMGGWMHQSGWAEPYLWASGWLSMMAALAGLDLIQSARAHKLAHYIVTGDYK